MRKRGSSQVDWAISFAIFLMYIAWFFLFVTPVAEKTGIINLIPFIEESLQEDITWTIDKIPLLITSNITTDNEPIITSFPFTITEFSLNNHSFVIDGTNLLFLANLTNNTNTFFLYTSNSTYTQPFILNDLTSYQEFTSTTNFKAEFKNSLLNKVEHQGNKIHNISYSLNNFPLETIDYSFRNTSLASIYKTKTQSINHTSYVFAKNKRIYNFITPNVEAEYGLTLSFDLFKYNNYFTNNLYTGQFNYSINESLSYFSDRLNLYSTNDVLTIILDKESLITLHHTNDSTLKLGITIPSSSNTSYTLIFHNDLTDHTNFILPYSTQFGIREKINGISIEKIYIINQTPYNTLKENYHYPEDREFSILLFNETKTLIQKGPDHPSTNVYARESILWQLTNLGKRQKLTLVMQTW